ncbi:hypothetical protein BSKO_12176 [Bryopsis sp. KO-2023]|nr:hypothetical protein BSKO_12176 [Bryopsis sp. KO-2023]
MDRVISLDEAFSSSNNKAPAVFNRFFGRALAQVSRGVPPFRGMRLWKGKRRVFTSSLLNKIRTACKKAYSLRKGGGMVSSSSRILQVLLALSFFVLMFGFWQSRGAFLGGVCPVGPRLEHVPEEILPKYPGPDVESPDRFTLILNSFHRQDLMRKAIKHYAICPIIEEIRVIWCEDGVPPTKDSDSRYYSSEKTVIYDVMDDTSLNNRFKPIKGLRTEAVMSIDDDIYVPCSDLDKAFQAWKIRKRQLVGFFPRVHTMNAECKYEYSLGTSTFIQGDYSIVLSKAAILHRDYLELYSNHMPQNMRDYVDTHRNCEDITIQFLVANVTHEPPEFVNSLWITDKGKGPLKVQGISSGGNHLETRTTCLNDLTALYGGIMPLKTRPLSDHGALWWIRSTPIVGAIVGLFYSI